MTAPHFWNADENLVTQMNGVKPDRELHDTFLDIEPITGVALSAHKRIQVQIKFKNYSIKAYKIHARFRNLVWQDTNQKTPSKLTSLPKMQMQEQL